MKKCTMYTTLIYVTYNVMLYPNKTLLFDSHTATMLELECACAHFKGII